MNTPALPYQLKEFDSTSLAGTKKAWEKQLADNSGSFFAADYDRILDWAAGCIDYGTPDGNSFGYGIFRGNSRHADAIVELVYVKPARKGLPEGDWGLYSGPERSGSHGVYRRALAGDEERIGLRRLFLWSRT